MRSWVKFIDKLPSDASQIGFRIQNSFASNNWIENCVANQWIQIEQIGKIDQIDTKSQSYLDFIENMNQAKMAINSVSMVNVAEERSLINFSDGIL